MKETDRLLKELALQSKETDHQIKETSWEIKEITKAADQRQKETEKRIRELNELFTGQWGKLMESLVEGDLIKLLAQRGMDVHRLSQHTTKTVNDTEYEYDLIAVNNKEVVVVEVKTTLKVKHVDHFINKLHFFKEIFHEYRDKTIYGAIAYLKANESAARNSEKRGLFVIRATGSSASITNAKHFSPRAF